MIWSLLYNLNHASLWHRRINVWDRCIRAASLDRLVGLCLHRFGWMGHDEVFLLKTLVRPGMHIVDVGANIGLYSMLLARLVDQNGSVLSFEPDPKLFAILQENCVNNNATNVTPFQCALGRVKGAASFHRSAFNSGDNRLGDASIGCDVIEVMIERFDDLIPDRQVDFIKIDVQGHELAVLRGMERALSANRDVRVLFEFSPGALRKAGTAPDHLLEFFRERGFILYETGGGRLKELRNARRLISDLRRSRYTNLFAARDTVECDD